MMRSKYILALSTTALSTAALCTFPAGTSQAFFLDGNGYFGARGETRVMPEFQKDRGTYQATELTFDLNGEVRANDRVSFNFRLGIFQDEAYLGDTAKPTTCEPRRTGQKNPDGTDEVNTDCTGRYQSTTNPGYADYQPVIREAYAKYAFNYCLLTVGRRSRDIGLGLLHSSAKKPFEKDPSIFDGVTCDVNTQKQQDLGFYFGFDKLQETGTYTDNPYDKPFDGDQNGYSEKEDLFNKRPDGFGPNKFGDDMDQFFLGLSLDDLKSKGQGASFAKQVGIYFSNILGSDSKTDVKYLDLYTGLYAGKFAFKNEIVFRMGKSADPSVYTIGGQRDDLDNGGNATNNMQSIGLAGELEYTWSRTGASIGPIEFNEGNTTRHVSFLTYAYAPGDADGYYGVQDRFADSLATDDTRKSRSDAISEAKRNKMAKAMAFHKNYKPALLFFNGKSTSKYLNRGGVFSADQLTNVSLFTLGYRYESQENGNFEVKLITGRLLEAIPSDVKDWYAGRESLVAQRNAEAKQSGDPKRFMYSNIDRPMGYSGQDLGYELDLMYTWQYRREVELGAGIAGALPGKAWEISAEESPAAQLGVVGSFALKF